MKERGKGECRRRALTQDASFFKLFMNDVGLHSAMYMANVQYSHSFGGD